MRLIDADELKKDLRENRYKFCDSDDVFYNIVDYIDDALTVDQWHYPSRGEYPISGADVWDGYRVVSYLPDLKRWIMGDVHAIDEPRCWCYLPKPPKEEE